MSVVDTAKRSEPFLVDRADGVRGHYCVARTYKWGRLDVHEYWNTRIGAYASAGTMYTSLKDASCELVERVKAEFLCAH